MNQVYTRPRYLENTWDALRGFLPAGTLRDSSIAIPLPRFIEQINSFTWPDDMRLLERDLAERRFASLEEVMQFFVLELESEHADHEANFGLGEETDEGKLVVEITLCPKDIETREPVPLGTCLPRLGRSEVVLGTETNAETQHLNVGHWEDDSVENGLRQYYYASKMLELYAVEIGKLVVRAKPKYDEAAAEDIKGMMELFQAMRSDLEGPGIRAKIASLRAGGNYRTLFNNFHCLNQIRLVQILSLVSLCSDREGAFDWFFSVNGPACCGPCAAELQVIFSNLWEDSDFPNLFEGAKTAEA